MNEEKDISKNILGKLKRLMTVTEKDVLEEEEKEIEPLTFTGMTSVYINNQEDKR